ncbi:MAG: hypothetical protein ACUVQY_11020 [Thermoproteota archaeon]
MYLYFFNGKTREIVDGQVVLEVPLPIADVLAGIPGTVEGLSHEIGLMLVLAVIHSECERIAGAKDSKNPLRIANWWGSQLGSIYYDKQKVLIDRPRLRGKDNKEIQLSTYKALQNPKGMNSSVMKQMILGISSRNFRFSSTTRLTHSSTSMCLQETPCSYLAYPKTLEKLNKGE